MRSVFFLRILLLVCLPPNTLALDDNKLDPLKELQRKSVSRFEWGLERYRNALVEHFRIDPISLQPSVPPFFINVLYSEQKSEILVEIGRTFGSTEETRAKELCEQYIVRARSMLAVDKLGRPVSKGVSTLAADYFFSTLTEEEVDLEAARALDEIVVLRGLVVAPASGIYAVCGASLTNMPIRHLQ
ncbi:MAG: hypothetical protein ACU84Q_03735 [Gammaproteobacteria bacterium]